MSDLTRRTLADLKPVWLMDPKEVDSDTHEDFYRHVSGAFDKPRFVHHFRYALLSLVNLIAKKLRVAIMRVQVPFF